VATETRRTKVVTTYFTTKEYNDVSGAANAVDQSLAAYLRKATLDLTAKQVTITLPREDAAALVSQRQQLFPRSCAVATTREGD
jgi:hypothetical protein